MICFFTEIIELDYFDGHKGLLFVEICHMSMIIDSDQAQSIYNLLLDFVFCKVVDVKLRCLAGRNSLFAFRLAPKVEAQKVLVIVFEQIWKGQNRLCIAVVTCKRLG